MPLVSYALAVYLAGLYAGFVDSVLFVAAAVVASAALGSRRGRVVGFAFAALTAAGVVAARETKRAEESCARDGVRRQPLTVVVEDSASPGAFLRGRIENCSASVGIAVERGNASPGSVVSVRGDMQRTTRGMLVQSAIVTVVHGPSAVRRMRSSAGRAIDAVFREDASLVRALLIADRADLSRDIQDRFAAAGLAHILSISGMHIGIIAVALRLCLELLGVARRRADIASIFVVVFYVALIGAPPPAVRSAAMLVASFASRAA